MNTATVRRRMLTFALSTVVALGLYLPRAQASTIITRTIEELSVQADAVIRGTIIAQESMRRDGAIVTQITLDVREKLRGDPPDTLKLWMPGGQIDNLRAHISGVTSYEVGDDLIVFLEHLTGDDWRSTSLSWSIYRCEGDVAHRSSHSVHGLTPPTSPLLSRARAMQIAADHELPIHVLRERILAQQAQP